MLVLFYLVLCYTVVINPNEAAKILGVFPVPSISHQIVFRSLIQELARRGHEVTVITPDPAFPKGGAPPNLTEIDVHDLSYKIWNEEFVKPPKGKINSLIEDFTRIFKLMLVKVFDAQLGDKQVQDLIRDKNQHFDLIITEACARSTVVFSHIYKAPVILVSSFGAFIDNFDVLGAPNHPILYPISISRKLNDLTMWDKLKEFYFNYKLYKLQLDSYPVEAAMLRKHFGPDIPPVEEINNNVAMLFLNIHPVFEGSRPVPPSVIYMNGVHQNPSKELPKDLKSYLDSSKNGVIYISFGTNVDPALLPPEKIQILVRVCSKQPYDVLWKWSKDELPGRTGNIKIAKWLPQSDLLKHPKIKLFITQGGLQSTDEALTAGVPMIGIPMLGDQWFNAEKYESHKIGLRLDLETITEEKFKNAIDTILKDDTYRNNVVKLKNLMDDQPMPPLERAVWWTEHVLRHGGAKHLRSPAANISWAQYLELELVLTLLIGLLTAIAVLIVIVRYLCICLYNNVFKNYVASLKIKRS